MPKKAFSKRQHLGKHLHFECVPNDRFHFARTNRRGAQATILFASGSSRRPTIRSKMHEIVWLTCTFGLRTQTLKSTNMIVSCEAAFGWEPQSIFCKPTR